MRTQCDAVQRMAMRQELQKRVEFLHNQRVNQSQSGCIIHSPQPRCVSNATTLRR